MTTLAQELPQKISSLEKEFGPDNPFVKMLKRQLEDINSQKGEVKEQTWQTQALKKPNTASKNNQMYDLQNLPFDPAEEAVREAYKMQENESSKMKVPPFTIAQADDPIYKSGLIVSVPVSRGLKKNSPINMDGKEQQQGLVSVYDPEIKTDPEGKAVKEKDRLGKEAKKTKRKANNLKKITKG